MFQILHLGNKKMFLTFVTRHECFSDTNLVSATIFPSLARLFYRDVSRCLGQQYPRMTPEIHSLAQILARVRYPSRVPKVIFFSLYWTSKVEGRNIVMETKLVHTSRIKSLSIYMHVLKQIYPYTSFSF